MGCVPGTTDGPAFTLTSRLMQYDSAIIVGNAMVCCGSKCTGCTWCRTLKTPPRLGAWAKLFVQEQMAKGKKHSTAVRALAFKWPRKLSGLARPRRL